MRLLYGAALLGVVFSTACGDDGSGTEPPVTGPTASVTVRNNFFDPANVSVLAGGTVTWTWNSGQVAHNVTFTSGPTPRPQNSGDQSAGTFQATFQNTGVYGYTCTLHAGMNGSVTVVASP